MGHSKKKIGHGEIKLGSGITGIQMEVIQTPTAYSGLGRWGTEKRCTIEFILDETISNVDNIMLSGIMKSDNGDHEYLIRGKFNPSTYNFDIQIYKDEDDT